MSENIISMLKANMNFLTNTEKKIAGLILKNPDEFITYSMQELSKKSYVSQGSIINFSKKFASGGFPDLKLRIASSIPDSISVMPDAVEKNDSVSDALEKIIQTRKSLYDLTKEINNEKVWENVVDKILKAKKIEIYGIFQSAAVATYLCYQLLRLGISASFVSDILTCAISAAMLDENSLVIAVSSSGKTKDIIDAVKNAKANNVPVVAITSNINSPLAKISDDVLVAPSGGAVMEACATQNLITDTICSYIGSRIKNKNFDLYKILNSHNVEETEYE